MQPIDLLYKLVTTAENVGMLADHAFERNGLTRPMYRILKVSARGEFTVSDISRFSGVSRQNVQTMVNRMVKNGLLELIDNPGDRRAPLLGPTTAGKRTATKTENDLKALAERFFADPRPEELDPILDALNGALARESDAIATDKPKEDGPHLRHLRKRLEKINPADGD